MLTTLTLKDLLLPLLFVIALVWMCTDSGARTISWVMQSYNRRIYTSLAILIVVIALIFVRYKL